MRKNKWIKVASYLYKQLKSRPIHWFFWHPHQKLWNWSMTSFVYLILGNSRLSKFVTSQIVKVDTKLWKTKVEKAPLYRIRDKYDPSLKIRFFDLGTHKEAEEIIWVHKFLSELSNPFEIIGFEAHPSHHSEATNNTASLNYLTIHNSQFSTSI